MNQQQKNYACERIRSMKKTAENSLRDKCTTKPIEVSRDKKIDLVLSGKVKLNKKSLRECRANGRSLYMDTIFDFSKFGRPRSFDSKKFDKLFEPIKKEAKKAIDEMMLGDAEEALKQIRNFENMCESI